MFTDKCQKAINAEFKSLHPESELKPVKERHFYHTSRKEKLKENKKVQMPVCIVHDIEIEDVEFFLYEYDPKTNKASELGRFDEELLFQKLDEFYRV